MAVPVIDLGKLAQILHSLDLIEEGERLISSMEARPADTRPSQAVLDEGRTRVSVAKAGVWQLVHALNPAERRVLGASL